MSNFKERSAHHRLNRLQWLKSKGCEFTFDVDAEINRIWQDAPAWKTEYGERAAADPTGRLREVKRETDPSPLLDGPVRSIVSAARAAEARADGFISDRGDPFSGLVISKPVRALSALRKAPSHHGVESGYWSRFLGDAKRQDDSPRMRVLIGHSLDRLRTEQFDQVSSSAASWFEKVGDTLLGADEPLFERLWSKLIDVILRSDKANSSALVRQNDDVDWATEALNSIAGELAELQMKILPSAPEGTGRELPKDWTKRLQQLLGLPAPSRQYVIVFLGHQLKYLYWYDKEWVEQSLLTLLENDTRQDDLEAFWSGFFWGARVPQVTLFRRLKPHLLRMASRSSPRRKRHGEILSGILLAGWHYKRGSKRLITSDELHNVILDADDDFRSHTLWQIDRWSAGSNEWSAEIVEFIDRVWPKQKKARNPRISERFVEIAINQADQFPAVLRVVLPLLSEIGRHSLALYKLRRSETDLLSLHPREVLDLLYACLPDDPSDWPYDAQPVVRELSTAAPEMNALPKMLVLLSRTDGV